MSTTFVFELNGAQQVPVVATSATSIGSVIYDSVAGTADYTIYVLGLDLGPWVGQASQTPATTDDVIDAHFHNAAAGVNGAVVFGWKTNDLDDFSVTLEADGYWKIHGVWETTDANPITAFQTMFANATAGSSINLYANIHTNAHGGGEIRGQLVCASTDGNDTFSGPIHSRLFGLAGNDTITSAEGPSEIDGGADTDKLIFDRTASSQNFVIDITTPATPQTLVDGTTVVNVEFLDVSTGSGNDNITGGVTTDVMDGGGGTDTLIGSGGTDTLIGGAGVDTMQGGAGNDNLDNTSGADTFEGGTDVDHATIRLSLAVANLTLDLTNPAVLQNLGDGTTVVDVELVDFFGGSGFDDVIGGALADNLNGGGEADDLNGAAGNDTLAGGAGLDVLSGGNDNDVFSYGAAGEVVANEVINGGTGTNEIELDNAGANDFSGAIIVDVTVLDFDSGNSTATFSGAQIGAGLIANVSGGTGTDTLIVNASSDVDLSGVSFLSWTNGTDTVTINGTTAGENLTGSSQNDTINGGDGADTMDGGTGTDALNGGVGNDTYALANGTDAVTDTAGIDTITSTITRSLASFATIENLTLLGTVAINGTGNALDNIITGNSGNNVLDGGAGNDTMTGGAGNDTYKVSAGNDTITDFRTRYFAATLSGANEVTPTGSTATGQAALTLNAAQTRLDLTITTTSLDWDGAQTPGTTNDNVNGFHVHNAYAGTNGGIVWDIAGDADTVENAGANTVTSVWSPADTSGN